MCRPRRALHNVLYKDPSLVKKSVLLPKYPSSLWKYRPRRKFDRKDDCYKKGPIKDPKRQWIATEA